MPEVDVATRSAALALRDERALMRQGYQFLDEKRVLLASEILRRLKLHQALGAQLLQDLLAAQAALKAALQRHGLEGLQAYPPATAAPTLPAPERTVFLGVPMLAAALAPPEPGAAAAPETAIDASPEARGCRAAYTALLAPLVQLAASSGNLERLAAEYRRTERRAKALENVLLPEIEQSLSTIEDRLELGDQEEAVRIRSAGTRD